jgi:hypothetical protein
MRDAHWTKAKDQVLLPTMLAAGSGARRRGWGKALALASCGLIFLADVLTPASVIVGLLYSLVVVGAARVGHTLWLIVMCTVGTLFHAAATIIDLAEEEMDEVGEILANRGLAVLVLWSLAALISYNAGALRARKSTSWTSVTID